MGWLTGGFGVSVLEDEEAFKKGVGKVLGHFKRRSKIAKNESWGFSMAKELKHCPEFYYLFIFPTSSQS